MAQRPAWSGFLRLSLVSVPVQAFAAELPNDGKLSFNQLHRECNSRIKYQKVCPIHGEVSNDEIVSAYQYESGRYVVVDDDELKELKSGQGQKGGIAIQTFVPPSQVDPLYFEGRNYYLLPDGAAGEQPYALLAQAMRDEERWGLAQAVLWGRNRLVLIRPLDKLLSMSLMQFANQVREPAETEGRLTNVKLRAEELRLAKRLIAESTSDRVDWSDYEDEYAEKLAAVIKSKVAGDKIIAPEPQEDVPVLSLIDALKRSVHKPKRRNEKPRSGKKEASSRRSAAHSSKTATRRRSAG